VDASHLDAVPVDAAALVESVLGHYRATLSKTSAAIAWLVDRGVSGGDVAEAFGLGFADRSLGLSLPEGAAGQLIRARLKHMGLFRATGHELFRGCLVVPIRDGTGRLVQCHGRRVQPAHPRRGTAPLEALWLPEPSTGIWNPHALGSAEVIVADSVLDGLVWWSAGYPHVVAAGGPAGLPGDVAEVLANVGVRRVLLGHARTPSGDRAVQELAQQLTAADLECFRVVFPYGEDASMCAVAAGDGAAALADRLRAAVWLGQGPAPRHGAVAESPSKVAADASPKEVVGSAGDGMPSPVPARSSGAFDGNADGGELRLASGALSWRVRGLDLVTGPASLRVTVSVHNVATGAFYLDVVDLFCARTRQQFLTEAAAELDLRDTGPLHRDMNRLLSACEDRALDLQEESRRPAGSAPAMTDTEEQDALELLRDPRLLDRISDDIAALGVVGERDNALLAYLAATSRLLDTPLAVVVQAGSGAGKSTLIDAVLSLMPEESRLRVSALTGQSLFYLDEAALAHKVLCVAEAEGAHRAAYPLRLLAGDGELSITSTGRDRLKGCFAAKTYRVQGPVALFLTTTATVIDDELANRALVLAVDADAAQTGEILAAQRQAQTIDGLLARHDQQVLRTLHANAQRLLQPVAVVIPSASQLSFADRRTRARRDQTKLLSLIRTVALLHQQQRQRKRVARRGIETVFIEATAGDVAVAQRLAGCFIGRPDLADLAPQTRRLLELLDALVTIEARRRHCCREEVRFTRRQAREAISWSDYALRRHLDRLVQLEFLATHRAGSAFSYQLLWTATDYVPDLDAISWASRGDLATASRPAPIGS